jgi:hypothetical protein
MKTLLVLVLLVSFPARAELRIEDPQGVLPATDALLALPEFSAVVRAGDRSLADVAFCEVDCHADAGTCAKYCTPSSEREIKVTSCSGDEATLETRYDGQATVTTKATARALLHALGNPLRLFLETGFGGQQGILDDDSSTYVQFWGMDASKKYALADGSEVSAVEVRLSLFGTDAVSGQDVEMPVSLTFGKGLPLVGSLLELVYFPNLGADPSVHVKTIERKAPSAQLDALVPERKLKVGASLRAERLSPDGHTVAVLADYVQRIQLFDLATGVAGKELQASAPVMSIHWSADGSRVAATSQVWDQEPLVRHWEYQSWEAATGTLLHSVVGYPRGVATALDAPADFANALIALSYEDTPDSVTFESLDDAASVGSFVLYSGLVSRARFSRAGDLLVTISDSGDAAIWRVPAGEIVASFQHGPGLRSAELSDDERFLLTVGHDGAEAAIWDTASRAQVGKLAPPESTAFEQARFADGGGVVASFVDKTVALFDAAGRLVARTPVLDDAVLEVDSLADGRIVTADAAGNVIVWKK